MKPAALCWSLLGLLAGSLAAQTDSARVVLTGRVVDPLGNPVEGAEVRVVGTTQSGMTSATGTFRLLVSRGNLLVHVRRPGYNQQLLTVPVTWSGDILLTLGAVQLPNVAVDARYAKPARYSRTSKYDEVFQRQRLGLGQVISRAEIDQRAAQETAQLLEGRAGIRVRIGSEGTFVAFSRCNEYPPKINVYVDGRKLSPALTTMGTGDGESILGFMARQPDQKEIDHRREVRMSVGEMLFRITPSDIEMVEIFRGPSELPPQFNDGNCGAIAIWTRQGAG
jgi:carboxypeptidase family protein/TonB-dependent receptor-like protein